jgi:hypothetical protein
VTALACPHTHYRHFTPAIGERASGAPCSACLDCGQLGEATSFGQTPPRPWGDAEYAEGAGSYIAPTIHGRAALLLSVGGVKRLAVLWDREHPSQVFPAGRLRVRVWIPTTDHKATVIGSWTAPKWVRPEDDAGPPPWTHPRLYAATCAAPWRREPVDETRDGVECFNSAVEATG